VAVTEKPKLMAIVGIVITTELKKKSLEMKVDE